MRIFENKMARTELTQILSEIYISDKREDSEYNPRMERYKILNNLLREYGYWPTIQLKWFFDKSGLVLLYHANKNYDYEKAPENPLYRETRSVILNMDAPTCEQSIVSSISHDIPMRITEMQYRSLQSDQDILETGYEGTMIHIYHHREKWYFSTTTCPSMDGSRYFHPTKTHGMMFDECLEKMFPGCATVETMGDTPSLRDRFVEHLDTSRSYLFVLIHHENRHIMDYTDHFGKEYKELLHISTKHLGEEESLIHEPYAYMGVRYPIRFSNSSDALLWLREGPASYAVIVKRPNQSILKICRDEVIFREETDLGNANPWHNMLWIFLKNRPDFTLADYMKNHSYTPIRTDTGKILSPTFVLHNTVSTITTHLFQLYCSSTHYNLAMKELRFKAYVDKTLAPILRFHLVQLRNIQKDQMADRLINMRAVSDYLRHHQTMKNIRMLIAHFAKNPTDHTTPENQFCIEQLHTLLVDRPEQEVPSEDMMM